MSQSSIAVLEGVIVLAPLLFLLAACFPVLMVTWVKSVPLGIRAPWAGAAAAPLLVLYAYVRWLAPSVEILRDTRWLTVLLTVAAYLLAIWTAIAFRTRHVKRPEK